MLYTTERSMVVGALQVFGWGGEEAEVLLVPATFDESQVLRQVLPGRGGWVDRWQSCM